MKRGILRDNIQDLFNMDTDQINKKIAIGVPVVEIYELMSSNLPENKKRKELYKMDITPNQADFFYESYSGECGYDYKSDSVVMVAFQKIRYDYIHSTHNLRELI